MLDKNEGMNVRGETISMNTHDLIPSSRKMLGVEGVKRPKGALITKRTRDMSGVITVKYLRATRAHILSSVGTVKRESRVRS
jgi:hypothetical protein